MTTQRSGVDGGNAVILAHTLTCTAEETLDRDRPSRSDSRLEEKTEAFGAFVGAGETE